MESGRVQISWALQKPSSASLLCLVMPFEPGNAAGCALNTKKNTGVLWRRMFAAEAESPRVGSEIRKQGEQRTKTTRGQINPA